MKAQSILDTIGHTPHVRINRLFGSNANVWIKSERSNPGGSIKDRIALAMVEDAEKSGALKPGGTIIEPTSGNTGIALAFVAAAKGYKIILTMPESMSLERRTLLALLGAKLELTPAAEGMKGAIARAEALAKDLPGFTIYSDVVGTLDSVRHPRLIVQVESLHRLTLGARPEPVDLLVLDEAQAIKNAGSKQTQAIKVLRARARIALTGTPVENRLGELWSIFDFLNPGLLGNLTEFGRYVKRLEGAETPDFAPLRQLVSPYLLRRLKTDRRILPDLPEKTELTAWCPLAKPQAALYQRAVEELAERLKEPAESPIQRRGLVLAFMMRLKQICNHPAHWLGNGAFHPSDSGKFLRLTELAEEIASRQERVLVFTQFREMTVPLAEHLRGVFGRPGLILDGSTPVAQRQRLVSEFQREDGPPFFVLSLKAGGTGLNLTAASHVLHFDRWWNPAVEAQAIDRSHRIGQTQTVMAYRLITPGTVEEKIWDLQQRKSATIADVLGEEGFASNLSKDDLEYLFSED